MYGLGCGLRGLVQKVTAGKDLMAERKAASCKAVVGTAKAVASR